MVSYKLSYLACEEEREKLRKEVEKLREELGNAHLELKMCMTKEEKEEILRKVEEISKMKAEEILRSEEFREKIWMLLDNTLEEIFRKLADSYAERFIETIAETIEEKINKILEKEINEIKESIKRALEDVIYDMMV